MHNQRGQHRVGYELFTHGQASQRPSRSDEPGSQHEHTQHAKLNCKKQKLIVRVVRAELAPLGRLRNSTVFHGVAAGTPAQNGARADKLDRLACVLKALTDGRGDSELL